MVRTRWVWALMGWLVVMGASWAQVSPGPAASAAALSTEAMDRVRRQAANPMRIILEAAKSRRRLQEPVAAEAADAARRSPARSAGGETQAVAVVTTPRFVALPVVALARGAADGVQSQPAPDAAAEQPLRRPVPPAQGAAATGPDSGISTEITLNAEALRAHEATVAVPGLEADTPPASLPVVKAALPLPAPAKPQLVDMVEPALTAAMFDSLSSGQGVTADLLIRADGSVATVTVLPPAPRPVVRAVVAALLQWRFDALPTDRSHRVHLVFNGTP